MKDRGHVSRRLGSGLQRRQDHGEVSDGEEGLMSIERKSRC